MRSKKGTKNEAEIVLIDHGLYCYINEEDRRNLCNIWKNIILKDEEKIKFYAEKLNVTGKDYIQQKNQNSCKIRALKTGLPY